MTDFEVLLMEHLGHYHNYTTGVGLGPSAAGRVENFLNNVSQRMAGYGDSLFSSLARLSRLDAAARVLDPDYLLPQPL